MPLKRTALKLARKLGCLGPQEQEVVEPIPIQPGLEPDEEQEQDPGRPYQAFVENEARQYWQDISNVGSLTKPTPVDIGFDAFPIRLDAMFRAHSRKHYTEAEINAMQPGLEPGEDLTTAPGRPYQSFVESEVRKYWQEMWDIRNLTKPNREEIQASAMPILIQALRNRTGHRRHQAVAGIVQHAAEQGWIRRPSFSEASESPSYIEALIQLADDANWLAREIPLPDHPPPRHPPIYYTIGSRLGRPVPVPREDALIRADYLYKNNGSRLTEDRYIFPIPFLRVGTSRNPLLSSRLPLFTSDLIDVDRNSLDRIRPVYYGLAFERARKPLNQRGVDVWIDWKEEVGDMSYYFSSKLRGLPFPIDLHFSPYPPGR